MTGSEPQAASADGALVRARGLGKRYRIYRSPYLRLVEWATLGGTNLHRDFWALRDVSFELKRGDRFGILGMNGAGKSTLLALLAGILTPDEGTVETSGNVASLLELTAGFHREFTGRENVFMAGQIRGLTRRRMNDHLDDIIAFAEIGEFIDQPVRMYSSGMLVRLAFSVATVLKPDVLIVDEVISVGDVFFQHKCRQRIKELTDSGTALVLVSHSVDQVRSICNQGLVLDRGRAQFAGTSGRAADLYLKLIREREAAAAATTTARPAAPHLRRAGFPPLHALAYGPADVAEIVDVEVTDESGAKAEGFGIDEEVTLRISAQVKGPVQRLGASFLVRDKAGVDLLGTASHVYGCSVDRPQVGGVVSFTFSFRNPLREGHYSISAAVNRLPDGAEPRSALTIHQLDNVAGYLSRGLPDMDVYHRVYTPMQVSVAARGPAEG